MQEACPSLEPAQRPGRRMEILIFMGSFGVTTGKINDIIPLCLLLRKQREIGESQESSLVTCLSV